MSLNFDGEGWEHALNVNVFVGKSVLNFNMVALGNLRISRMLFPGIAFFIPFLIGIAKFQFNSTNINYPLNFTADELLYANQVQSLMENGGLKNSIFGAPFGQDLNFAFFSVDLGPAFLASFLAHFGPNLFFGMNLLLLLSFGLSSLLFYFAAIRLGSNQILALISGCVFALLPAHFVTNTMGFTNSNYFLIPLVISGFVLLFSEDSDIRDGKVRQWNKFLKISGYMLFGAFYSYHSLGFILIGFTVLIIKFVAFYGWSSEKLAYKRTFVMLISIFAGFLLSAIPALVSAFNTVGEVNYFKARSFWGAFANSGTFVQSVIPIPGSLTRNAIVEFFPELDQRFIQFQNLMNGTGLFLEGWVYVIPTGVVLLLIFSFFLSGRINRKVTAETSLIRSRDRITTRTLILIIFSTLVWSWAGGAGTLLSLFSLGALRGFSRLNIFVICAILLLASRLISKLFIEPKDNYGLKLIGIFLILFAFSDVLSSPVSTKAGLQKNNYESLSTLTTNLPKGCPILQFPVVHYPYQDPGYPGYSLLAPGLSQDGENFRWSSGSVGGSPAWVKMSRFTRYQNISSQNLFDDAKRAGFCAILIDVSAWESFENFRPNKIFPSTPLLSLDSFLAENAFLEKMELAYGDYYLSLI